jgi:hypothetical protein
VIEVPLSAALDIGTAKPKIKEAKGKIRDLPFAFERHRVSFSISGNAA